MCRENRNAPDSLDMSSCIPEDWGYSTNQKKPNREHVCEREQNGYRTGTRTQTERVQNGYRTDTERKWNGYRTVTNHKNGKKRSPERKLQENVFFRTHASKLRYQSAYQGFGNDVTLNTRSFNFLSSPAILRKWQNEWCYVFFLFLFTRTKQASSLHLLVHFEFIAAILFCQQAQLMSK